MVVLGGVAVSYDPGTPVTPPPSQIPFTRVCARAFSVNSSSSILISRLELSATQVYEP